MIQEGRYWQAHLNGAAAWLESWTTMGGFGSAIYPEAERLVFTSCFAARKLLESSIGPGGLREAKVTVCSYPRHSEAIDTLDSTHFSRSYDLMSGKVGEHSYLRILNLFIHSHHFSPFVVAGKPLGIFVASDRTQGKSLAYITVPNFCSLLRAIARAELHEPQDPA